MYGDCTIKSAWWPSIILGMSIAACNNSISVPENDLSQPWSALTPGVTKCVDDLITARGFAQMCELATTDHSVRVDGSPSEEGPLNVSLNIMHSLALKISTTGSDNVGVYSFLAPESGEYVFYLGSSLVPFTLKDADGNLVSVCGRYLSDTFSTELVGRNCPASRAALVATLAANQRYQLEIGPTDRRSVRLIIVRQRADSPPASHYYSQAVPQEICDAAANAQSISSLYTSLGSEHSVEINQDVTYGINFYQHGTDREAAVAFMPSVSGEYAVWLSAPNIGLQIREQTRSAMILPERATKQPENPACPVRAMQVFKLKSGVKYRLEITPPGSPDSSRWVRLLVTPATYRRNLVFFNKFDAADGADIPSEIGPAVRQVSYMVSDWSQAAIEPGKFGNGLAVNQGIDEGWDNDGANFFGIDNQDVAVSLDRGTVEFWFKFKYDDANFNHAYFFTSVIPFQAHFDAVPEKNVLIAGWNGWDYGDRGKRFFFCVQHNQQDDDPCLTTADYSTDPKEGSLRFFEGTDRHFAFVWDRNGIASTTDTMRIYVDGVMRANSSRTWKGAGELIDRWLYIGSRPNVDPWDTHYNGVFGVTDNLKIFNCAKTDFSDRESP